MPGTADHRYDVFLSHASANKRWVDVLANNLKNQGYRLFYDDWSLVPGGEPLNDLYDALQQSRAGILVVSPEAANSGWVGREYAQMITRKTQDPDFLIVPVVYGEMAEFPFLNTLMWVDFREPHDYRRAFHRLLCALARREPGADRFEGALELPGADTHTPLEVDAPDFFAQIIRELDDTSIQLLLAQEGRAGGPVIQTLLDYARQYYGADNVLHLAPLLDPQADINAYFWALAQQCGFAISAQDAAGGFQIALHECLTRRSLFLLISGFESSADEGRARLASMLRSLHDVFPRTLKVVLCGGERLVDLRYANGDLSMLSVAGVQQWPELGVADVQQRQAQLHPVASLAAGEAVRLLEISGGHPRLLHECLDLRRKHGGAVDYGRALATSPTVYQSFLPYRHDAGTARRLCELLDSDDLGPAEPYLQDNLLRRLYWKNLVRQTGGGWEERLVWRCGTIRDTGRALLGCARMQAPATGGGQRRQAEIDRLNAQWQMLTEKLDALEKQKNLETRAEEKLRLNALIDEARAERDRLEQELQRLERQ